ncbi:peroxisome proliferator-activated receptor gamma coactivator 1-beta [Notothenia coriiceps]|uniref:Peroxisome proliferator-activated receptor gamma coactivator 1-beta n=1 Tax=Notothenia coriiceps TaxID=8208 RepID=A0A6I9Q2M2_9TELE|nr:PREDICTED: peroxisome proliferator-activated receptor gamma coactivator 1-beta-like [Notothenia coriiceps]
MEEENAALLAALTDSLDGMVDAEVGGLSVFPVLGEEPNQEEEDEDNLSLSTEDFSQSLGSETEDPSLRHRSQVCLSSGWQPRWFVLQNGFISYYDSEDDVGKGSKGSIKMSVCEIKGEAASDLRPDRKPRAVRPSGRLCTELHKHLTTARDTEEDKEEEEEDEEEEDSESEEEDEDEEEESSSSEVEGGVVFVPPPKSQFSSEKELRSVVDLITYMHTYCLPIRKQQAWDQRKEAPRPRARNETPRPPTNTHSRVVLVSAPGTGSNSAPRRMPFARRREMKANSLLRDLLQQSSSYDVSKPYGLQTPPYVHSPSRVSHPHKSSSPPSTINKLELRKDSQQRRPQSPEDLEDFVDFAEGGGSFSVRRSRRLASFPSRFGKRLRPGKEREGVMGRKEREEREEARAGVKVLPTQTGATTTPTEKLTARELENKHCCHNEKRACLCLPLNSKNTGESQYSSKPFEQTLGVDLCGTAGLTPPTTPPHKPVEDELFKPSEAGKPSDVVGVSTKASSSWLSRAHPPRKLLEQTELYAQLRRMGQAGANESYRTFGDHDYCALSLGESRKRSADMLGAMLQAQSGGMDGSKAPKNVDDQGSREREREREEVMVASQIAELLEQQITTTTTKTTKKLVISSLPPPSHCQSATATPPVSEEEAERSSASRSPSPTMHLCPDSPASKTDSSENSEMCPDDKQRNKAKSDEDNCQVFYIHNLPTSVTQNMLRKRFQVFGKPEDCKVIICNEYEAGPGPVKSKYDALDFDTLLKEAQKSLHR